MSQDWHGPAHCGDFCRFERQVGRRELTELAADGDGERVYRAAVAEEPLDWAHLPADGDASTTSASISSAASSARHP